MTTLASSPFVLAPERSKASADTILRRLDWQVLRRLDGQLQGDYRSLFTGHGFDLAEVREYQSQDDIRYMDWNVTARMGSPYIRKFREERELAVILTVDISGSADFGSVHFSKREAAAEAAAIIGFSAAGNGDKVGLLLFAKEAQLFVPPAKGNRHVLRIVR